VLRDGSGLGVLRASRGAGFTQKSRPPERRAARSKRCDRNYSAFFFLPFFAFAIGPEPLHFVQFMPSFAAATQHGCAQTLPAAMDLAQQPATTDSTFAFLSEAAAKERPAANKDKTANAVTDFRYVFTVFWGCCNLVRAAGVEPASHAWEAHIIPIYYARKELAGNKNIRPPVRNHEYARRPSRALFRVTESAYNTPPPLGRPKPIRITRMACPGGRCSIR